MKTVWFQSEKTKEDQEKVKELVLGSKLILDKAKQIVYTMIKDGEKQDYDSPSWAYKQADQIGYNRALKEIMSLLTVDDK